MNFWQVIGTLRNLAVGHSKSVAMNVISRFKIGVKDDTYKQAITQQSILQFASWANSMKRMGKSLDNPPKDKMLTLFLGYLTLSGKSSTPNWLLSCSSFGEHSHESHSTTELTDVYIFCLIVCKDFSVKYKTGFFTKYGPIVARHSLYLHK